MPSLMRSLNSSHVVGAVSGVHGVCGLLPTAGLVSSILLSSLFWSFASCAMIGRSKGPNPLRCVGTAPFMGGGDGSLRWYEDCSCEISGDSDIAGLFFSMLKFDGIGQDWLLQNEERCAVSQLSPVVSLVGGAPGWCENCVLSVRLRGPALKEGSQSQEGFISVCCESLPTLQVRASVATARAWRASAGFLDQMGCYCAAAASLQFAFWYLGTLEADFSAAAAFEGDLRGCR